MSLTTEDTEDTEEIEVGVKSADVGTFSSGLRAELTMEDAEDRRKSGQGRIILRPRAE